MKIPTLFIAVTAATYMLTVPTTSIASQATVKLAEKTVMTWGGPETRTRCIGYASGKWPWPAKGGWKTCNEWATDLKQHRLYLEMYGPQDMEKGRLPAIKDSCLVAAVATGVATAGNKGAITSAFTACVKTTEFLGRIVVSDFRLNVKTSNYW